MQLLLILLNQKSFFLIFQQSHCQVLIFIRNFYIFFFQTLRNNSKLYPKSFLFALALFPLLRSLKWKYLYSHLIIYKMGIRLLQYKVQTIFQQFPQMSHPQLPELTNQEILTVPNTSQSIKTASIFLAEGHISKMDQSTKKQCKICLQASDGIQNPLMSTCLCTGSLRYVHKECFQDWLLRKYQQSESKAQFKQKNQHYCEICQSPYLIDFSLTFQYANFSSFLAKVRANKCAAAVNIIFVIADILCLIFSCNYAVSNSKKQDFDIKQAKYFLVYFAIILSFISTVYGVYQFVKVFMMEEKIVVKNQTNIDEKQKKHVREIHSSRKDCVENKGKVTN